MSKTNDMKWMEDMEWLDKYANARKGNLLPCPFCGELKDLEIKHTHTPHWWVECNHCGAEVSAQFYVEGRTRKNNIKSIKGAIEMWNTRNGIVCARVTAVLQELIDNG